MCRENRDRVREFCHEWAGRREKGLEVPKIMGREKRERVESSG